SSGSRCRHNCALKLRTWRNCSTNRRDRALEVPGMESISMRPGASPATRVSVAFNQSALLLFALFPASLQHLIVRGFFDSVAYELPAESLVVFRPMRAVSRGRGHHVPFLDHLGILLRFLRGGIFLGAK